jgi:hypothetical protein
MLSKQTWKWLLFKLLLILSEHNGNHCHITIVVKCFVSSLLIEALSVKSVLIISTFTIEALDFPLTTVWRAWHVVVI